MTFGFDIILTSLSVIWKEKFWGLAVYGGIAVFVVGALWRVFHWLRRRQSSPAKPELGHVGDRFHVGDINTNSGINSGHIGSINHHHHGKQPFTLTPDIISAAVAKCPKGVPVEVWAVGPQGSSMMQERIAAALRTAGFSVGLGKVGSRSPMPNEPLMVENEAGKTVILVTPSI